MGKFKIVVESLVIGFDIPCINNMFLRKFIVFSFSPFQHTQHVCQIKQTWRGKRRLDRAARGDNRNIGDSHINGIALCAHAFK